MTCHNCGELRPTDETLALKSGWIPHATSFAGCVGVYHFCPKCETAAKEFWKQYLSEKNGPNGRVLIWPGATKSAVVEKLREIADEIDRQCEDILHENELQF